MEKILEALGSIRSEMEELAVLDVLDEEQEVRFAELSAEFDTLEAKRTSLVERAEKVDAVRRAASDERNVLPASDRAMPVPGARDENPFSADFSLRTEAGRSEARGLAMRAIESDPMASDDEKQALVRSVEKFDKKLGGEVSRHILHGGNPVYREAFGKIMSGREAYLTEVERDAVVRAQSLTDSAGGFAVPTFLDPSLILTNNGATNPIRALARKELVSGDNWNGVTTAGVTAAYKAENAESADGTMTLAQPTISVHTADVTVPASIAISMDWAGIASEVVGAIVDAKDRLEASVFVSGTGTNQPWGVVNAVDGITASRVAATTNNSFGLVDVYALADALPVRHRNDPSAAWAADNVILNDIRQFGSNVANVWKEGLQGPIPTSLLGKPIFEASEMDGAITTGDDDVLLFGNFSRYVIADRIGLTVEYIPHLFATANNLPSGTRGYYAYWRNGADSIDDNAFRLLRV